MITTNANVLLRCTGTLTSILVVDGGVVAENMITADTEDPRTRFAILVSAFVEIKAKTARGVLLLAVRWGEGHPENSR